MKYPTMQEIEQADRIQLARWYRFLPLARTEVDLMRTNRICERFGEMGGFTPAISKLIGWNS